MRRAGCWLRTTAGVCTLAWLAGCHASQGLTADSAVGAEQIEPADITYREVAEAYNRTVADFDTLFLRTYVRLAWEQANAAGETVQRREAGDGKLIFASPRSTVLTIEKLSRVYLWAGSNDQAYWLFDQVDEGHKVAYVGRHDAPPSEGVRRLPLPFRPDHMPFLLGLLPLDPALSSEVYLYDGQYLIEPEGMRLRMFIDPASFRPTRVDLLDPEGESQVTCRLTGRFGVEVEGVDEHRWPAVCDDAEIFVTDQASRISIELVYATTNPRRVRDRMFDLDVLLESLEPDEVVDLDRR